MEETFRVGVITQTHGVKGEVKVFPTTSEPARFKKLKTALVELKNETKTLNVESVKFFKQFVIIKFKEINSIDDATPFLKKDILVLRSDAIRLKKNEYYFSDLEGMDVFDEEGCRLGILTDVLETGANDCYNVRLEDGRDILIPAIKQCILDVDVDNKKMTIHVMDGLID